MLPDDPRQADDAAECRHRIARQRRLPCRNRRVALGRAARIGVLDDDAARAPQRARESRGGRRVEHVVVGQLLALEGRLAGRERARFGARARSAIPGSQLVRVLAVPQCLDLLERDGQRRRIWILRPRQAGLVWEVDARRVHPTRKVGGDPRVVRRGMPKRLDRERRPKPQRDLTPSERREDRRISVRRRDDRDIGVILGRGADHRRTADVDLLDELVERDARTLRGRRKRIEVHHHELERADRRGAQRVAVLVAPGIREDPGMDAWMQCLDAPVEHLRKPGHTGDVGHGQARVAQCSRRAARRHELEAEPDESGTERDESGLVRDRQQRTSRAGHALVGDRGIEACAPRPGDHVDGTGKDHRRRQREESMFDRLDPRPERGLIVVREHVDRLLENDRAAIEDAGDEVDRAAADRDAGRERVADRVRPRECWQQRRMRVDDPAAEGFEDLRPEDAHIPGEHDDRRTDGRERVGERVVPAAGHERGFEPVLRRPLERGAGPIREDEPNVAAQVSAFGGSRKRAQV